MTNQNHRCYKYSQMCTSVHQLKTPASINYSSTLIYCCTRRKCTNSSSTEQFLPHDRTGIVLHHACNYISSQWKNLWKYPKNMQIPQCLCIVHPLRECCILNEWNTSQDCGWFLVNDQRDAQLFSMYLSSFLTLYMFRAHRAHHQERQIVSIQPLVAVTLCRWLCLVQVGSELYI
jgi:hypothetical protein